MASKILAKSGKQDMGSVLTSSAEALAPPRQAQRGQYSETQVVLTPMLPTTTFGYNAAPCLPNKAGFARNPISLFVILFVSLLCGMEKA